MKEIRERVEQLRQQQQPQLKQKIQDDRKNEEPTIQQGSTNGNDYMSQRDAAPLDTERSQCMYSRYGTLRKVVLQTCYPLSLSDKMKIAV